MRNSEQLITWGLLALIAYELWPKTPAPAVPSRQRFIPQKTNVPPWAQQLSAAEKADLEQQWSNPGMACAIIDNLLSIPQGPGGACEYPIPPDYFAPSSGIFTMCR